MGIFTKLTEDKNILFLLPNWKQTFTDWVIIWNPWTEWDWVNIWWVTYESTFKVSDINGSNYAQTILHRHSTTLEPLIVWARSNSNDNTHANITNSQNVFSIYGTGWAWSNYKIFWQISILADSTWTISNTSAPWRIELKVTPDWSTTPATVFSINNKWNILSWWASSYGWATTSKVYEINSTWTFWADNSTNVFLDRNIYWDGWVWRYKLSSSWQHLALDSTWWLQLYTSPSWTAWWTATLSKVFEITNTWNITSSVTWLVDNVFTIKSWWEAYSWHIKFANASTAITKVWIVAVWLNNWYWSDLHFCLREWSDTGNYTVWTDSRMIIKSNWNVWIWTTSPNASAILQLSSTTKGFLPPIMTTTQKNAISSPATWLVVFDSTLWKLCVYSTTWQTVTSS